MIELGFGEGIGASLKRAMLTNEDGAKSWVPFPRSGAAS